MEWRNTLQKIWISIGLILALTLIGVSGFTIIEGYTLLDALYMTTITISTVGFGTIGELSPGGKLFSIFLIITSASVFVYAITNLTSFIIEGEIRSIFHRYKIDKTVNKLKDHIIICGLGRNGREAASELIWQRRPFVAIENDSEVIADFLEHHECLIIQGDATQEEVLEKANIKAAHGLISALSSDAENVFITLSARELSPALHIVSRASSEAAISKLKRAGANQVILPHLIGGRKMANLLTRPALVEFVDMITGQGNPDLHLEEIHCEDHPDLTGKTLAELDIRSKTGVMVIGRKREGKNIELNLHGESRIEARDILYILGKNEQFIKFRKAYLRNHH